MDPVGVVELLQLQQLAVLPALVLAGVRPHPVLSLYEQGAAVQIDREEPRGRLGPLQLHVVNRAEVVRQALRASSHKRLAHEDHDPVLLRHGLQAHRHVDVGGEVGGVDLELRADRALDGPAEVQAEAQAHAVFVAPREQRRVLPVLSQLPVAVRGGQDLDEGHDAQLGDLRAELGLVEPHAPDEKEGLPHILVRGPEVLVYNPVHDLRDLVHEDHRLLLQHLRGDGEVLDLAVAVDGLNLPPRDHRVHADVVVVQVVADNLTASLAEAQREQGTELDDRVLQDLRLHRLSLLLLLPDLLPPDDAPAPLHPPPRPRQLLLLAVEVRLDRLQEGAEAGAEAPGLHRARLLVELRAPLLVAQLDGVERVLPYQLDLVDHPLDRVQHQVVRVRAEHQRAHGQGDDDEHRADHAHGCLGDRAPADVEQEQEGGGLCRPVLGAEPCDGRQEAQHLLRPEGPPGTGLAADQRDPVDAGLGDAAVREPGPRHLLFDVLGQLPDDVLQAPPVALPAHEDAVPVRAVQAELPNVTQGGGVNARVAVVHDVAEEAELEERVAGTVTLVALHVGALRVVVVVVGVHEDLLLPGHAAVPRIAACQQVLPCLVDHLGTILRGGDHHSLALAGVEQRHHQEHGED
mmetsp:Transcript_80074/g.248509  ORF Transcript_80074/g.248509 Transcript_80074/m.248509 type:complete len:631 (-) Transcript_80074:970-2862(-)